jgi:excisionase family DNA binding protein
MTNAPLTTGEIAEHCHVTDRAVLKWIEEGKLKAYRTPGNHSRVNVPDFIAFLREYNMPVPAVFQDEPDGKKKVLIVDDDRELVSAIRRALFPVKGIIIDVAYDGFSAGQKFTEFKPDLVLLDMRMPGLDGYEVCSLIRKDPAARDVKIIIISGMMDMDSLEKVAAMGANDFLAKPFRNEFLRLKVERIIGIT